ncbi:hypothetical protein BX666DRAFT_830230 [Dichotomocladium elegans]|nr:hypothetical protein BX666DRAFT_830230 [Dichotomocladium elegans]
MTPSYPYKGATASQLDPTSSSSFNDLYSAVYSAADESCKMNQQQQHPLFNEIHQPRMTVAIATVGVDAASDIPTTLNYSRASSAFTNELPISSPAVPFNLPPILGLSARPTTTTTTTTTAAADTSPHYVRSGEQADSSGSRLTAEFPRTLHHTYEPSNVRSNADDDKSSPTLSKEAIIINAQEDSKDAPRRIFPEMDDSRIPESALQLEHLVSPYAIREAEREEKEEAMGASREHPFRGFSSFISMKNMHEKLQCDDKYKSSTNDNAVNVAPANFSIRPDDGVRSYRYHHHHHHQYSPPPSSPSSSVSSAGHDDDLLAQCINNTFASQTVIEPTTIDSLDALIQASSSEKKPAIAAERERLKRPPNAYLLFNRDMRRKLLEISPKMTVAEISKEIGERWKQLSPVRLTALEHGLG